MPFELGAMTRGATEPNTLSEFLERAWLELGRGVASVEHGFHWPVVSTIDARGHPSGRVVVLRRVIESTRTLVHHTDARSPKVAEVQRDPRVAWTLHDHGSKLQLRATGTATLHYDDDMADHAWAHASVTCRRTYLAPHAPSTVSGDGPSHNRPAEFVTRIPSLDESEPGRDHLCVVACRIASLDVLSLDRRGHRRARFSWSPLDDALSAQWLHP